MRLCLGTTCLLRAVMKTLERAIIGEVHPCCQYPEKKPFKSLAEASRPCQMQRSDRKKSKNASGSSRSAAHRLRCHLGRTDVLVNMEEIRRIIFFLQLHQAPVVHSIGAANALLLRPRSNNLRRLLRRGRAAWPPRIRAPSTTHSPSAPGTPIDPT